MLTALVASGHISYDAFCFVFFPCYLLVHLISSLRSTSQYDSAYTAGGRGQENFSPKPELALDGPQRYRMCLLLHTSILWLLVSDLSPLPLRNPPS